MTINARQKGTLIYLLGATFFTHIIFSALKFDVNPNSNLWYSWFVFAPPIIFGIALSLSNRKYAGTGTLLTIPMIFWVIYIIGTFPFYSLLNVVDEITGLGFDSRLLSLYLGCLSAISMVAIATRLMFDQITIGKVQVLLMLLLPILCVLILSMGLQALFLVYQSAMTIVIVSSMKTKVATIK